MTNLAVPVMRTFTVSEIEVAAYFNSNVRDAGNFLLNRPEALLIQSSATTSVTSGAWVAIGFDSSTIDSYGGHSNATNNSRYTAQVSGWYTVCGVVAWPSATGSNFNKWARIAKNGTAIAGTAVQMAGNAGVVDVSASATPAVLAQLNAGDYVELNGAQFTGSTISTRIGSDGGVSSLYVVWEHS